VTGMTNHSRFLQLSEATRNEVLALMIEKHMAGELPQDDAAITLDVLGIPEDEGAPRELLVSRRGQYAALADTGRGQYVLADTGEGAAAAVDALSAAAREIDHDLYGLLVSGKATVPTDTAQAIEEALPALLRARELIQRDIDALMVDA
jgi:hypothetical protein